MITIVPTLFDTGLSDIIFPHETISQQQANKLFVFFQQHSLFNWKDSNNGCEGRADAVCLLLDEWHIPNFKAWIFGGYYLKKHIGGLVQDWNYHVASVVPVRQNEKILYYVIDPATGKALQLVEDWAAGITQLAHSYYFIRQPHWYIFPAQKISTSKWNTRNSQNRKWMIQCLAGINGLTATGKARLCFNKSQIKNTLAAFNRAKKERPALE